jgi:hypothetical protein
MSDVSASRHAELLDGQLCDLDRIANRARANLNLFLATVSVSGSLRSTRLSARNASLKARVKISTSSGVSLLFSSKRIIGMRPILIEAEARPVSQPPTPTDET